MRQAKKCIVFWQLTTSPHMAGLVKEMAERGWRVHYVAVEAVSADRVSQGWSLPDLGKAELHILQSGKANLYELLHSFPANAVHICQGIRENGYITQTQAWLRRNHRIYWLVMETIDDSGLQGFIKRMLYAVLFRYRSGFEGVLTIGYKTSAWVESRGVPRNKIHEFAYFLPNSANCNVQPGLGTDTQPQGNKFKFVYIGQLIARKRVDLLLEALAELPEDFYALNIIGSGELESALKMQVNNLKLKNVSWLGTVPINQISDLLIQTDCLVLPSRHDGWGAVISEALLSGTRVICSDTCGSAGIALASSVGYVFESDNLSSLVQLLNDVVSKGMVSESERIATRLWAKQTLSDSAGSVYLEQIIAAPSTNKTAPWHQFFRSELVR